MRKFQEKLKCIAITKHWPEMSACFEKKDKMNIFSNADAHSSTEPLCYGNSIINFIIVIIWNLSWLRFSDPFLKRRRQRGLRTDERVYPLI